MCAISNAPAYCASEPCGRLRLMLVGRVAELELMATLLADNVPLAVVGEAGVGKTSLLRSVAERSGRRVFEGGAHATLSWMDLLPFRRALARPIGAGDYARAAAEVEHRVGRGVLILDDLQWADTATMEVIAVLAGRIGLMAGVRTGEPGSEPSTDRLRLGGFTIVEIEPLAPTDAAEVAAQLRPDLSASAIARLVRHTGGNPLLLHELSVTGEPSRSLRLAVAARLRQLDLAGREAFNVLALAGRPMTVDELGESGAKAILGARLAVLDGDTVSIRHALLAEVALELLGADERRALHARLARSTSELGESARHHALAGEDELAHKQALRAADAADRPGEQASHLGIAALTASGGEADALRLRAAFALERAEDWSGVDAVLDRISTNEPELRGWQMLLRGRAAWYRGDAAGLRAALVEGLAITSGLGTDVEVELRIEELRIPIFIDSDFEAGKRMARKALDLASAVGVAPARAEYFLGTAMAQSGETGWERHLESAIASARRSGHIDIEFRAANNLISGHEMGGSQTRARQLAAETAQRASALGLELWARGMRAHIVNLDFHAGAYQRAIDEAEALLQQPTDTRSRDEIAEALMLSLVDVGRFEQAAAVIEAAERTALPDHRGQGQLLLVKAEAALWSGQARRALEAADAYLATIVGDDPNAVLGRVTRAWAAFECDVNPGPPVGHQELAMLRAAPVETAGLALMFSHEHRAAATMFDVARELWRPYHRRGELRGAWAAGEALRLGGDIEAAGVRLEEVEIRAQAHLMEPLLKRIRRSLRAAGRYRSAAPRSSGSSTPAGLSARQNEVLELVGTGLSNKEIAARLGLSPRTVETHIASAAAKLKTTTRAQAAVASTARPPTELPLIVVEGGSPAAVNSARADVIAAGWPVVESLAMADRGVVCVTAVSNADEAGRAVLAAIGGAGLIVDISLDRDFVDSLCDDLRRLGSVDHRIDYATPVDLDGEQRALLSLLLGGASLARAASALHLSRRTADRRLAAARRLLGANTTSEAVVIARRLGLL